MSEHHEVLSGLLDISLPEIDKIINAAIAAGAYGAKIVGSGRGGCMVAIAPEKKTG
jgi:galactokinase